MDAYGAPVVSSPGKASISARNAIAGLDMSLPSMLAMTA
jgi:hypothetical protein